MIGWLAGIHRRDAMVRRAVVDDFVGIIFLIGAVRAAPRAMARAGMESSRVAEAHKFPLRCAGGE